LQTLAGIADFCGRETAISFKVPSDRRPNTWNNRGEKIDG